MRKRILAHLVAAPLALAMLQAAASAGGSSINTGQPATDSNLSSLVVRQLALAAASDINAILGMHAATSAGQCPASPVVGVDCLLVGSTPYTWTTWTGSGWATIGTIDPASGAFSPSLMPGTIVAAPPLTVGFSGGVATIGLNINGNFAVSGGSLTLNPIAAGDIIANCTSGVAEPTLQTWSACMDRNIGSTNGMLPLRASGVWGNVALGASVGQPGTGLLENLLPVQTNSVGSGACTTSCVFASADLFKKTRRSNSGTAMTDTFPAAAAAGMVNGTRIVYANADATATATITAGAGTTMASGGSTDTVGPGRDVAYEYDLASTQWRGAYNTRTALLSANNLSDLGSIATARGNLIPSGTITNTQLVNQSTTVNGQTCTLGATCLITASAGSITVGTTTVSGGPGILYNSTNGGTLTAASLANNSVVVTNGSGVPSTSTTLPTGLAHGTPSSITLTNATGLPISTGLTGAGTGVLAALGNTLNAASGLVGFSGALGTPTSGTLTNATGLPISTGVSGLGTNVTTALGVNIGSAGAPVLFNGAGGTPTSLTLTSATGLPLSTGVTGTLQAAQEPAHTGGCTNSAGSLALSCQINTNFTMGSAGNCGAIGTNQTVFFGPNGCYNASETQVQSPVSTPFTLKNFYASSFQAPGGSQSYILTVRKNAVSTSITCTISAAATTCNDTTHTASFAAGDLIDVQIVLSASAAIAQPMTMATAVTTSP